MGDAAPPCVSTARLPRKQLPKVDDVLLEEQLQEAPDAAAGGVIQGCPQEPPKSKPEGHLEMVAA